MYQITINKIIYHKVNNKSKKEVIKILTETTTKDNLVNRILELKKCFKDFNYQFNFEKIRG